VLEVTGCVIVHVAPGGIVAALKPTDVPPLAPPVRVAPPEVHDTEPAAAFVRPAGYASEIAAPVSEAGFAAGFVTVMVSVAVPPTGIAVGAKVFVTAGAANAFNVPLAEPPVTPFAVAMAPVLFTYAPGVVTVTLTV